MKLKPEDILLYEAHSSWWISYMPADTFLGTFASWYLSQKVNRKYKRYAESMKWKEIFVKIK